MMWEEKKVAGKEKKAEKSEEARGEKMEEEVIGKRN